jgi:secernin
MMAILRDHGEDADWSPANTPRRTICMHASTGARRSQSVASMVSESVGERTVHWVTATSAPCTAIFKPVILEAGLPDVGPSPTDQADAQSLWWRHERLHRALLADFGPGLASFEAERDALETDFRRRIDAAIAARSDTATLRTLTTACWHEADLAERRWTAALPSLGPAPVSEGSHRRSWARLNQVAGLPAQSSSSSSTSSPGSRSRTTKAS